MSNMSRQDAFVKEAAGIIKEYCRTHVCAECPFCHLDEGCGVSATIPEEWEVEL